jgi:hypothetical protein
MQPGCSATWLQSSDRAGDATTATCLKAGCKDLNSNQASAWLQSSDRAGDATTATCLKAGCKDLNSNQASAWLQSSDRAVMQRLQPA